MGGVEMSYESFKGMLLGIVLAFAFIFADTHFLIRKKKEMVKQLGTKEAKLMKEKLGLEETILMMYLALLFSVEAVSLYYVVFNFTDLFIPSKAAYALLAWMTLILMVLDTKLLIATHKMYLSR